MVERAHSSVTLTWWADIKNPTDRYTTYLVVCPSHRKNLSLGLCRGTNLPKNLSLSKRRLRSFNDHPELYGKARKEVVQWVQL